MSRCSVKLNPAAKDIMASLTLSLNNTSGIKTWTTATFAKGHILVCMLRGHQRLCEASFKNKLHLSCIHIEHSQCLLEKCFVREKENLWPSYSGNESGHFIRHQHSTNWKVQSQIFEEATNGIYRVVAPCIDANAQKIKPCGPNRVLHKQNRKTDLYCIYCVCFTANTRLFWIYIIRYFSFIGNMKTVCICVVMLRLYWPEALKILE